MNTDDTSPISPLVFPISSQDFPHLSYRIRAWQGFSLQFGNRAAGVVVVGHLHVKSRQPSQMSARCMRGAAATFAACEDRSYLYGVLCVRVASLRSTSAETSCAIQKPDFVGIGCQRRSVELAASRFLKRSSRYWKLLSHGCRFHSISCSGGRYAMPFRWLLRQIRVVRLWAVWYSSFLVFLE